MQPVEAGAYHTEQFKGGYNPSLKSTRLCFHIPLDQCSSTFPGLYPQLEICFCIIPQ